MQNVCVMVKKFYSPSLQALAMFI